MKASGFAGGWLLQEFLSGSSTGSSAGSSSETFERDYDKDTAIGFISLPRIDLGNPLRWPSLIHEIGHFEDAAKPGNLWSEFSAMEDGRIGAQALLCMKKYLTKLGQDPSENISEIQKWLMECWCDAHATRVAGAPALFSQMHAFLFSAPCYLTEPTKGRGYPPAWFRLRLMRDLITTRHIQDNLSNLHIRSAISEEWETLVKLFPPSRSSDIRYNTDLKDIFNYFLVFLTKQFPQDKWLSQSEVNPDDMKQLIDDLSEGLPIPTHRDFVGANQTRTSHAEILLAGWSYRNNGFQQSLLDVVKDKRNFQLKAALPNLIGIVDRADASLQMAIQVSEWFGILEQTTDRNPSVDKDADSSAKSMQSSSAGLLTDHEIVDLLREKSLRVIPLIGGTSGIEGTSIDIRLGHNFEIFFTNISGTMDALHRNRRNAVDSMEVDYDSLDGLEISPGQFVLGHTLEYLKLPADVAAEVNGRSSFARLGIEVHMTAPFVEAGFDGCLTFEISNSGHSTVKLYPGMRIAQLRFYRCTSREDLHNPRKSES